MPLKLIAILMTLSSAYLIGSINASIILSKIISNRDIRKYGSGNAGLTNMLRIFGPLPAICTLIIDFAKGAGAVLLGKYIMNSIGSFSNEMLGVYLSGIFVIVGHIFPIFFQFKGGKGILTAAGVIAIFDWRILILILSVFAVITLLTKYVSLASVTAAATFFLATAVSSIYIDEHVIGNIIFSFASSALVIIMHHANIGRLIAGTENKLGDKKAKRRISSKR